MCNQSCLSFGYQHLTEADIRARSVLEVGSRNVNGSLRSHIESLEPSSYLGVDIFPGEGVDEICNAERLIARFGPDAFDVVIATEVLEHVRDWREVVDNLKVIVRRDGILFITTRSRGFPFHQAPYDFWRYEVSDMREIFSDFTIDILQSDPQEPGVFLKARKPRGYSLKDLSGFPLYSMVTQSYVHTIEAAMKSEYEGKLVRRQGTSPEDNKVYLVREGLKQWIIDAGWIVANGFRWPEDVTVISADELDQIPTADPLM